MSCHLTLKLAVLAVVLMDSKLQKDADQEGRSWIVRGRRRLIAGVAGLMMLGIALDPSEVAVDDRVDDSANTSSQVTVDEFERIEALLATTENRRVQGRGPTVEVPSDVAFVDERPAFDFDAFDEVMGSPALLDVRDEDQVVIGTKPPSRDSFDDLNRITVLEIPDQMALGNGHRVIDSQRRQSKDTDSTDMARNPQNVFHLSDAEPDTQQMLESADSAKAVRIVAADVTASKVTRFAPAADHDANDASDRIRFTGIIFPVSRQSNQK